MPPTFTPVLVLVLAVGTLLLGAGCSKSDRTAPGATASEQPRTAVTTAAATSQPPPRACSLLTADALRTVGDQAAAAGPVLMIRTGDDLITLTMYGVDDHGNAARRIVEIMRPRMGPSSQPKAANRPASRLDALDQDPNDARALEASTLRRVEPHSVAIPILLNELVRQ